jgi:hypothetical protein
MTIDLDRIEQLARAATPGPWDNHSVNGDPIESVWLEDGNVVATWAIKEPRFELHAPQAREDAAFIAAANPTAVLELVQRLRAGEAENVQLKTAGMSLNETIAKSAPRLSGAIDRMHRAEAIVRDLAARPPIQGIYNGGHEVQTCALCGAEGEFQDSLYLTGLKIAHSESCPWRRAVEVTK